MSIIKAIEKAYILNKQRNWQTIYWAVDLHGVCLNSNYENGNYTLINDSVIEGLKAIQEQPESKIILWSSCHLHEQQAIIDFFKSKGIHIDYFNKNPLVPSTKTGDFSVKFYFSILIDDKAGFDPETDWTAIKNYLDNK